ILLIYSRFESARELNNKMNLLASDISEIKTSYNDLNQNLDDQLFMDHLKFKENIKLKGQIEALSTELESLKSTVTGTTLSRVNSIYTAHQAFKSKFTRNSQVKLDIKPAEEAMQNWGQLLLDKKFDDLDESIKNETAKLDDDYK